MTLDRVAAAVVTLLCAAVAAAVLSARPPVVALARHGATGWAVVLVVLAVWPLVVLATARWLEPGWWAGLAAVVAVCAGAVAARWRTLR